jgi:hypothetical protein
LIDQAATPAILLRIGALHITRMEGAALLAALLIGEAATREPEAAIRHARRALRHWSGPHWRKIATRTQRGEFWRARATSLHEKGLLNSDGTLTEAGTAVALLIHSMYPVPGEYAYFKRIFKQVGDKAAEEAAKKAQEARG